MRRHLMKAEAGVVLPAWFKEHIVCWYSPKRQGVTNESLAADPKLIDLSGKGMDLELVNFSFTEVSGINAEGALKFNGACYGRTASFAGSDSFTYIAKRMFANYGDQVFCSHSSGAWQGWTGEVRNTNGTRECFIGGDSYVSILPCFNGSLDISWLSPTKYKECVLRENSIYKPCKAPLTIGNIRIGDIIDRKFKGVLYDFFLFDETLSQEQINYVVNHLID